MNLKEQTIFFFIIIASLLIGAVANEAINRKQMWDKKIEDQYIFNNPEFKNPKSYNIPLTLETKTPWVRSWIEDHIKVEEVMASDGVESKEFNPIIEYTQIVLKYLPTYYPKLTDQSKMMPVFSCLLRNESGHYLNKNFGDNGRAAGVVQFHEPTYIGYRTIMIDRGLVDFIGSRMNPDDAIHTMIWAFSDGRGTAWGPYARQECK